ncbi:sensor histidine kinase [Sandaracinus amylolyticus]|nr:ATP-binding protein [Sandaracinus amylolyticus]
MARAVSLASIVDQLPAAMVVWDGRGRVRDANRAFYAMLGHPSDPPPELDYWSISAGAQKQWELNRLQARRGEPYDKELITASGERISVRVTGGLVGEEPDGDVLFAATMVRTGDGRLGSEEEHERTMRRRNELYLRLATSLLAARGDLAGAIREVTEAAAEAMGVKRTSVWLYDPSRTKIVCQDLFEVEQAQHSAGAEIFACDHPDYFEALAEDRAIVADDVQTHIATRELAPEYLRPLDIVSMLDAPVRFCGQLAGVLCFEHCGAARQWDHDDVQCAASMADFVGRALEAAERVRAEQELQRANEELERRIVERTEAVHARDEFLSIASHELRTPLTPLKLQMQLLAAAADRSAWLPNTKDMLRSSLRQVRRLEDLVSTLLDVTRASAGRLEMKPAHTDLAVIASEVVERFRAAGTTGGSTIALSIEPRSIEGTWDPLRVDQVLTNLLSNAIKYGEGRPIDVHVVGTPSTARIEVRDHGIGIAEPDLERIFERFVRASSARSYGGLGLGLYIAHQIVSAHGGTIVVASTPGQGSTFVVELPRRLRAPAPEVTVHA